jgi:ABC-2 type transport system ATP-binding protein
VDPVPAVVSRGLTKTYGKDGEVHALDGFDLTVETGSVHGLLGPNGAGKTTAVRILTTLIRPDSGHASVAGVDVLADPMEARRRIGLAGQYAAVDEVLTGRQNLELFGRLFHLGKAGAQARATELLAQFDLVEAADKGAADYSGGMRRRLDLAASMILAPQVLFLDEPTTGLDPRGRNEVWESVRALVRLGTTVLLTTQYLDEADQLADRVSVIDAGRTIADGTPDELKARVGGDRLEVVGAPGTDLGAVVAAFDGLGPPPEVDESRLLVAAPVDDRVAALTKVAARLQASSTPVADISLRRPTLDDVFLRLTGHRTDEALSEPPAQTELTGPTGAVA